MYWWQSKSVYMLWARVRQVPECSRRPREPSVVGSDGPTDRRGTRQSKGATASEAVKVWRWKQSGFRTLEWSELPFKGWQWSEYYLKCCQYQPIVKKWKWADLAVKVCSLVPQHFALKILVLKSKVNVRTWIIWVGCNNGLLCFAKELMRKQNTPGCPCIPEQFAQVVPPHRWKDQLLNDRRQYGGGSKW